MPSDNEPAVVDELATLLLDTLALARPPDVPARFASVESLRTLHANLVSLREFLGAVSNGDSSKQVPFKGYVGGALKTLQSNLRHMTWQTKMVASGDLTQRVEFMGEFAEAFNAMTVQLDQTLNALRASEEALTLLAITDPLTGLYNRRHFNTLAEDEVGRAIRYARPLSVMMFDLDFFKRVNDTCGHAAGDAVLRMVAATTKATIRTSDIAARYGGEEFVVLLPETPIAVAVTVAERLRRAIEGAAVHTEGGPIVVTASFGLSDYLGPSGSRAAERVLQQSVCRADRALYASKHAGRNRVTVDAPDETVAPT